MEQPTLSGIHHLKIPASDVEATFRWYERVFGASRRKEFDHIDHDGILYGIIIDIPGLGVPIEVRLAPKAAKAVAGYDPVTFGVADFGGLEQWVAHLDACGVPHSPVITGYIGHVLIFADLDGLSLRLYTNPVGGFDAVHFDRAAADIDSPWANTPLMERERR